MRKMLTFLLTAIFLAANLIPAHSIDGMGIGDINVPAQYALDKCATEAQLDCIESVGIVSADGTYIEGIFQSAIFQRKFTDRFGNEIYVGETLWQAGEKKITLNGQLDSPVHVIDELKDKTLRGAALRIYVNVSNPLSTRVRVKVRSSWLRPQSVQVKMFEADYKDEIIPGGHRWTFEGSGLAHSSFNSGGRRPDSAKADYDGILFDIYIHHAGKDSENSYFPPICADQGYTVQSNNTNETGEPMWDRRAETLIFGIYAPHLTAAGELNKGYFKFWTTDKFLNCKFPTNTLSKASDLKVEILYEDGTQAVATTQVTHKDGKIFVLAAGFHFSSPKIVITPDKSVVALPKAVVTPTPTPSATAVKSAKITITCQKGKNKKKLTGLKPICPSGYKKVS